MPKYGPAQRKPITHTRPVALLDSDGDLLCVFPSARAAASVTSYAEFATDIEWACKHKVFAFRYLDELPTPKPDGDDLGELLETGELM